MPALLTHFSLGEVTSLSPQPLDDAAEFAKSSRSRALFAQCSGPALSADQIQQLSPAALAYIGDAVYELYVRSYYLTPPQRIQAYHQQVVAHVRAESQVRHLETLDPYLTESERVLLKRGRNAAVKRKVRTDAATYQQATGFETLIGYLYVANPARLSELLAYLEL